MKSQKLIEQLETYSNAIVAFAVLQALAYAYAFGSNEMFNCYVKVANHLAAGLSALFLLMAVLLVIAIEFCRKTLRRMLEEQREAVGKIYRGKLVAVAIFSLLPLALTFYYGVVLDTPKVECNKLLVDGARK